MSTGTDVAMHTAGITLMRGDPSLVADAIDISRRTCARIRQNLFWAFIHNVVDIPAGGVRATEPSDRGYSDGVQQCQCGQQRAAAATLEGSAAMNSTEEFNIGEAASRSGVSAKMVRHYESLGLLPAVARTESGYRRYGEKEVHALRFVRRARSLGFSMAEIAELLKLWQNRRRASTDVKRIAQHHVADLERRMAAMAEMRDSLKHLADCCRGNQRPDCPILEELSGQKVAGP